MHDFLETAIEEINNFFSDSGTLAKLRDDYEFRESQLKMAINVFKSLVNNEKLIIEAGTGIGKSYAYLVPVIIFIKYTNQVVVISTETKNLQSQLYDKDLQNILDYLKEDIPYHIALGRNNYICKRRTNEQGGGEKIFHSESEYCLNKKCKYLKECDYVTNREIYMNSKIIICNHHLLFSDCQARFNDKSDYSYPCVLPSFRYLIIDEAHKIDLSATSCISEEINFKLYELEFSNANKLNSMNSVNSKLIKLYKKSFPDDFFVLFSKFNDSFTRLSSYLTLLFLNQKQNNLDDSVLIIDKDYAFNDSIVKEVDNLILRANKLNNFYTDITKKITINESTESDLMDISAFQIHLLNIIRIFKLFFYERNEQNVYYLQKSNGILIKISPIYVSEFLKYNFFNKLKSVIMTSATLSHNNNDFSFFKNLSGLNEDDIKCLSYPSPYVLSKNMKIIISTNTNKNNSISVYDLTEIIKASNGGCLVLFTNKTVMNHVFTEIYNLLISHNINSYCQGQNNYSNEELLSIFKRDINSVLFGLDSFWEGIDVPGNSLRQVIIYKLPFPYVKDPMYLAREKITEHFFTNYSLPYAVIKFKQGVGRLIRNSKDRGVITVLDNSIIPENHSYGSLFINSIKGIDYPEIIKCSIEKIPEKIKSFLF